MNRLAILDTLEVNSDAGGGVRSTAGASVNLPNSEKFSLTTKRSVMHSLNLMERQKQKALKVVEKMQQQF